MMLGETINQHSNLDEENSTEFNSGLLDDEQSQEENKNPYFVISGGSKM